MPIVYEHPLAPSLVAPIAFASGYGIARNRSKAVEAQLQTRADLAVGQSLGAGLQQIGPAFMQGLIARQKFGLEQADFELRRRIYQDRINQQWIDNYGGTPDDLQREYQAYRAAIVTPEDLQNPNVIPQGVVLPPEEKPLSFGEFLQRRRVEIAARNKAYGDALAADLGTQQEIQRYEQGIRLIRTQGQQLGLTKPQADMAIRQLQQRIVEARTGVTMPPPQTIRDVMDRYVVPAPDGSGFFIMNPRTSEIRYSRAGGSGAAGGGAVLPGGVMPPAEAAKLAHTAALGVVKAGAFDNPEEALEAYDRAFAHIYGRLSGQQGGQQGPQAGAGGGESRADAAGALPRMPNPEQLTYGRISNEEVLKAAQSFKNPEQAKAILKDLVDRYRTRGGFAAMKRDEQVRFLAALAYLQSGGSRGP